MSGVSDDALVAEDTRGLNRELPMVPPDTLVAVVALVAEPADVA